MVRLLSLAVLAAIVAEFSPVATQPLVKIGAAYTADALAAAEGGLEDGAGVGRMGRPLGRSGRGFHRVAASERVPRSD